MGCNEEAHNDDLGDLMPGFNKMKIQSNQSLEHQALQWKNKHNEDKMTHTIQAPSGMIGQETEIIKDDDGKRKVRVEWQRCNSMMDPAVLMSEMETECNHSLMISNDKGGNWDHFRATWKKQCEEGAGKGLTVSIQCGAAVHRAV